MAPARRPCRAPARPRGAASPAGGPPATRALLRVAALFVVAALGGCGTESAEQPVAEAPRVPLAKNLVLISLDTLRADRLGCYGFRKPTSPNLDAFAEGSLLFTDCTSAASNTAPSHMSMFTGLAPSVHRVFNVHTNAGEGAASVEVLPSTIPTLAERLSDAGFHTAAFTDGGYVTSGLHFDRGFAEWQQQPESVDRKVDRVLRWLERADRDQRLFLFFHTYEIHSPYLPPPEHDLFTDPDYDGPWRERYEALRAGDAAGGIGLARGFLPQRASDANPRDRHYLSNLYNGGIHFTDAEVGRLLDVLSQPPWSEDTLVIVTSDHGEAFEEHGKYSHGQLYQTVTHVPLLVRVPGGPTGRVEAPVSGVDVLPTVLEGLGLPAPEPSDGESVFGALRDDRPVVSFNGPPWKRGGVSVRVGAEKVLRNNEFDAWERYQIERDPRERDALPVDGPRGARLLDLIEHLTGRQQELSELLRRDGETETTTLSPETLAELEALGYLGGDG